MEKTMRELFLESHDIDDTYIKENIDFSNIDDFVRQYVNSEMNYNNADITSGMRCFSSFEIFAFLKEAIEK